MFLPDTQYPLEKLTKAVIFLKNFIANPNIEVSDYTYFDGRARPESFETENIVFAQSCKLIIGKFCQIAYGTKFLCVAGSIPVLANFSMSSERGILGKCYLPDIPWLL
ncbi:MAG: hypothetical protein S4CHLAM7_11410 [Chlamydiae bacterium]|nr:hypothetical protein [Chlamydiota bacterium]